MKAAITAINNKPYIISALMLFLLLTLAFSYIYFLSLTVVHVVMRKETDRDITRLHSQISSLESEYMAAQHRISTEISQRTDLTLNNDKIFINKAGANLVLSSRSDR